MQSEKQCCQVCNQYFPNDSIVHASFLRPNLQESAKKFFKKFQSDGFICLNDLRKLRNFRIEETVEKINSMKEGIKEKVIRSINKDEIISENVSEEYEEQLTFGEKASDIVARFGGSWSFIGLFVFLIALWVTFNNLERVAFDPFPFIFLNLFLSCIAAFQAPIIMMSQNRQAEKDRLRDIADYQVNLKAELEIQQLHNKLDLFMSEEWHKLLEIQKLQIEIAEDIVDLTHDLKKQIRE